MLANRHRNPSGHITVSLSEVILLLLLIIILYLLLAGRTFIFEFR